MWYLNYPNIEDGSTCDYKLKPVNWSTPIVVIDNYLTSDEVKDYTTIADNNTKHAICNMSYSSDGGKTGYSPGFRRSADLNSKFFPSSMWTAFEQKMLDVANDFYGAGYPGNKKPLYGHSFCTIYRDDSGFLGMHSDAGHVNDAGVWSASVTTRYEMTGLIYLTSSGIDFQGGIIKFPYIRNDNGEVFEYVPKAGAALFFPANPIFAHEVTESSGKRIIFGSWRGWRPYKFKG